jgi:hypothetical protein
MHIRWSTHKHRGGGVVQYAQLVESYRRPDGVPGHRVIANLGRISDVEFDNFRAAIRAGREGRAVLVDAGTAPAVRVRANFAYLAVAVLLRTWRDLGLDQLLGGLLGTDSSVEPSDVVAALVLQRCLAPGSKLSAIEWFPTTALPELLGVAPKQFNNSRVHRVLDALDAASDALQARLPERLHARQGAFVALFLDATDTWFEGRGPDLAKKGRDKEGIYRRRIGIVLVCDQRGYPLAWRVVPGDYRDTNVLLATAAAIADWEWARGLPVVLDRAAGRPASVGTLCDLGLRFLTALPSDEFASCGANLSWDFVDRLDLSLADDKRDTDLAQIREAADRAGFERVSDERYVRDLGVFDKHTPLASDGTSQAIAALRLARRLGEHRNADNELDDPAMSTRNARRYAQLLELCDELQGRIAAGDADRLTLQQLREVARLPRDSQQAAFDRLVQQTSNLPRRISADAAPVLVRGVLQLNPERLLSERRSAARRTAEIESVVAELNESLAKPSCRRRDDTVLRDVQSQIERCRMGDIYTVELVAQAGARRLVLYRNEERACFRRRSDGLNLFVAHPDTSAPAADLVELYFAKDRVEKDFQLIKSVIELRPVHHRTDPKLRAHVTICMLAMLLECVLDHALRSAGVHRSADRVLEALGTCHLNLIGDEDQPPVYLLTERTPDQTLWLSKLGMKSLADPEELPSDITPR